MNVQNIERSFEFGERMMHYKKKKYMFMYDNVELKVDLPVYTMGSEYAVNHMGSTIPYGMYIAKHTETGDILLIYKKKDGSHDAMVIQKNQDAPELDDHALVVYMDDKKSVWARPREMFFEYLPEHSCYRFEKITK